MSYGDRYTSSSYRKIFGDSPKFPVSSSRMGSGSTRGSPGLRSMAVSRNGASSLSLYRRIGRTSTSFSPVPAGSLDLTHTSIVNNEFKVIRTNEKEQLQVGGSVVNTHVSYKLFEVNLHRVAHLKLLVTADISSPSGYYIKQNNR